MKTLASTLLFALILTFILPTSVNAEIGVGVVFSDSEISIISAWYRDHDSASRKGGGKKQKGLPPGIAKNLARGKALPPGIARNYLPDTLRYALPEPRQGHERIIVDGKILLVEIATGIIHDVLMDVIVNR